MDPTSSVSKGCFVFKNGITRAISNRKCKPGKISSLLGNDITSQPFYISYINIWTFIKDNIEDVQKNANLKIKQDIVEFIENCYTEVSNDNYLPTAALLIGINQPDHCEQFELLTNEIKEQTSSLSVILQARNFPNLKTAIETTVYGFIKQSDDDIENLDDIKTLRLNQCNMKVLESWYKNEYKNFEKKLIITLPDFECFDSDILQDFILVLSTYCHNLPIILILGIATLVTTLHSFLPYHVTSKIKLKIFQIQSAASILNQIIDDVILSPLCPFRLSGKALQFLTDIFLFYDFSITGFIQGFKYCIQEHFNQGNAYGLCCNYADSIKIINNLTKEDIETIRKLFSFRPFIESMDDYNAVISFLQDDNYFKRKLPNFLYECHIFITISRIFLEFLYILVNDLPKHSLGRTKREIFYMYNSSQLIKLPEYKECWQMLSFLSKDEFIKKITLAINTTKSFIKKYLNSSDIHIASKNIAKKILKNIESHLEKLTKINNNTEIKQTNEQNNLMSSNRKELKDKLLEMANQEKPLSLFNQYIIEILKLIENEIIIKYLIPFNSKNSPIFMELFIFSDITLIRKNIVGTPRTALHTALNNPQYYLQCNCCNLDNDKCIVSTLPDISIVYKLHLECGRMINLFDWLQAFKTIVDFNDEENEEIDPQIQARFTRAVAELQFLGYIKTSKRKTDHVTRLTW